MAAWKELLESGTLNQRLVDVYQALKQLPGGASASTLAKAIPLPRDSVSPRLAELLKRRLVHVVDHRPCPVTGKTVQHWAVSIPGLDEQERPRPERPGSLKERVRLLEERLAALERSTGR